jgi:3-methyladenine DNA glycosylase AlkD
MKSTLEKVRAEFNRSAGSLTAPKIKDYSNQVYGEVKKWTVADRDRFCEELFASSANAEAILAIYVYRRFAKTCGAREFRLFTRWLDRYVDCWGHTDGLSLWLLGGSVANDPSLIGQLYSWTRSNDRWKRRAAAVTMVPSARRGVHTKEILEIAAPLIADSDDMVQKGVGWLLKETYPRHPQEVVSFLLPRRALTPRLVLRYAAEKMTGKDRKRVLDRVTAS